MKRIVCVFPVHSLSLADEQYDLERVRVYKVLMT
jgi:hypothetical protein